MVTTSFISSENTLQPYEEIKDYFEANECWGLLTSIDLQKCDPKIIRSEKLIEKFVIDLCELIKMKRFQETRIVHFGADEKIAGYSMVQLIETSLISGHFANLANSAYIDIFSCKLYNPYLAGDYTKNFFNAASIQLKICFRK